MVHKQNRGQRCPERCEDERKTLPVPYAHKRKELLHHSQQVTRKKRTIEVTRWPDSCLMAHHLKLTHTHTLTYTVKRTHTNSHILPSCMEFTWVIYCASACHWCWYSLDCLSGCSIHRSIHLPAHPSLSFVPGVGSRCVYCGRFGWCDEFAYTSEVSASVWTIGL